MNNEFEKLYLIEMVCIDEGNPYGLKLNDVVYRLPIGYCPGTETFTDDVNKAWLYPNLTEVKQEVRRIYRRGNFRPSIRAVKRDFDDTFIWTKKM